MSTYKGMYNPAHPGEMLLRTYMEPLKLTQTEMAAVLGVPLRTVSALINEQASITPVMALRLSLALGGTAQVWLDMQANYDAWQLHHNGKEIRRQVTNIWPIPARAARGSKKAFLAVFAKAPAVDEPKRPRRT